MKTPLTSLIIIAALTVMAATALSHKPPDNAFILLDDKSYFSDFAVVGEDVYFHCTLFIENKTGTDAAIAITAASTEDVDIGLLKDAALTGYDASLKNTVFHLPKYSVTGCDVVFVGKYGGVNRKTNRLLPKVTIRKITLPSPIPPSPTPLFP